jgi:hypothetical protein
MYSFFLGSGKIGSSGAKAQPCVSIDAGAEGGHYQIFLLPGDVWDYPEAD